MLRVQTLSSWVQVNGLSSIHRLVYKLSFFFNMISPLISHLEHGHFTLAQASTLEICKDTSMKGKLKQTLREKVDFGGPFYVRTCKVH